MFQLEIGPGARGSLVETLHKLNDVAGLVITVQGSGNVDETIGDIVGVAPRLAEDHTVSADGLIVSRAGSYRVLWGVVSWPGGSLAMLTPLAGHEGQEIGDWTRHFMKEVLDPVRALSGRGYSIGGGGNGQVGESEFAQAFREAYV
ncbi:MAG TPA: hypothetical protein VJT49_34720 [Amycolatopsis sp.]|uniref:hypothetical protein n=1 Tax=Amycolatopsis sp. TaxID=37632 RepID=UPI002B46D425|nr:hypothetical protein [Amycolatopsis sp.]HKS50175.1 hypothetical protein [Amycolatopsis sp.]